MGERRGREIGGKKVRKMHVSMQNCDSWPFLCRNHQNLLTYLSLFWGKIFWGGMGHPPSWHPYCTWTMEENTSFKNVFCTFVNRLNLQYYFVCHPSLLHIMLSECILHLSNIVVWVNIVYSLGAVKNGHEYNSLNIFLKNDSIHSHVYNFFGEGICVCGQMCGKGS